MWIIPVRPRGVVVRTAWVDAYWCGFSSVQSLSHVRLCALMDCSSPSFPVHHQLLEFTQNSCPLSGWCHPTISSSVVPFSRLQSFLASVSFKWVSSLHQVAKVLEFQLQHQSFQQIFRTDFLLGWTGWISLHPRDSQESSPTPHFKIIHSSVLSFLYSPTLTSIHDYWKLPPKNI